MKRRALIFGISGQDGAYLADVLLARDYEVWGTSRDAEMASFHNLEGLGIRSLVNLISLNLRDSAGAFRLIQQLRPGEVYNLAAQSSVALSFEQPVETIESIIPATVNLLEAIRLSGAETRVYNAGSTECFGDTCGRAADENSPFRPTSPYAVAKAATYWIVANYRQAYKLFACTGILSNHDSPLRPARFVTRKIVRAAAEISRGVSRRLTLGNLHIERDWGWAPDYVQAMWLMLQRAEPEDFVVATGESYPLSEFVEAAFRCVGLDWKEYVDVNQNLLRPTDIEHSRFSPAKAHQLLNWRPSRTMPDIVRAMIEAELLDLDGKPLQ
ncbi:MAG: GDP-mannose 4,6-dehydratase [Silvibacterium sp.]